MKRKNQAWVEMVNIILINLGLPNSYWGEMLLTSCYILNRISHKI